jgi:hypothetical protein
MSEKTSKQSSKGEATFAPGGDIFDPSLSPEENLKVLEEHLLYLEEGMEMAHLGLLQVVQLVGDFHHDQGLANLRFMDSLGKFFSDSLTDEERREDDERDADTPGLTVVD